MNLTATLEGDADRDGFGDETQDRCLGLSFSRRTFAAAKSGSAFSSQRGRKRRKTPVGTTDPDKLKSPTKNKTFRIVR